MAYITAVFQLGLVLLCIITYSAVSKYKAVMIMSSIIQLLEAFNNQISDNF
jgi:hypothetical protein